MDKSGSLERWTYRCAALGDHENNHWLAPRSNATSDVIDPAQATIALVASEIDFGERESQGRW
jgi:hypothetical protein